MICIVETWLTGNLASLGYGLENFEIVQSNAEKNYGRGRPSGGSLIAYNTNIYSKLLEIKEKNIILLQLKSQTTEFFICSCYCRTSDELDVLVNKIQVIIEDKNLDNKPLYLCGDFNSRIGCLNSIDTNIELFNCQNSRESADKVVNKRGVKFCNLMEQLGFIILNGRLQPDIPAAIRTWTKKDHQQ